MPKENLDRRVFTPPQLARRWAVTKEKIYEWIRTGELLAMDMSSASSSKPIWRIDQSEVSRFELSRREAGLERARAMSGVQIEVDERADSDHERYVKARSGQATAVLASPAPRLPKRTEVNPLRKPPQ